MAVNGFYANTAPEMAVVTECTGNTLSLVRGCEEKNIPLFAPMGYSFSPPQGSAILTVGIGMGTGVAAMLMPMQEQNLASGEIKIAACGGYIHFKTNGSVVINGVQISLQGVITTPTAAI